MEHYPPNAYYITFGYGQPMHPGYIKVHAHTENDARRLMLKWYGRKWAGVYLTLDNVHPRDRKELAVITPVTEICEPLLNIMRLNDVEDAPDGAWQQILEDTVSQWNKTFETELDPYTLWLNYVQLKHREQETAREHTPDD